MLTVPRVSICRENTNLSRGKPKLRGGGCFCSGGTFRILSCDGFALKIDVGHGIQEEGDAGRNVLKEVGKWKDGVEEDRIHM